MQRRARSLVEIVLVAVVAAAWHPAVPVPTALEPATTGGIETVDRSLAKLSTHRRVMVVGAHPDDEDNTVLALVSRGLGGEAAYLSLSRGEGGQNLVGPELGIGLGLIRTGELLAARRIEGSRQFFTRAFDFGYTRSLEETFERWPREIIQEDAVRAVRRFKPQVIVAVFPGDSRAGHGQHQMAGVIAVDMFDLAGEPDRFPGLTAEGLPPWQPEALYRRLWWGQEEPTFELLLGQVDPLSGRSMLQIAAASRSMHRSQDMGRLQPLGSRSGNVGWVAGEGKQD
jgi:LmbE family N-acetylglucosaminyl deacetylase